MVHTGSGCVADLLQPAQVCPHRQHFCCQPARHLSTWLGSLMMMMRLSVVWWRCNYPQKIGEILNLYMRNREISMWAALLTQAVPLFWPVNMGRDRQQMCCSRTLWDPGEGFIHKLHSSNARNMINKKFVAIRFSILPLIEEWAVTTVENTAERISRKKSMQKRML